MPFILAPVTPVAFTFAFTFVAVLALVAELSSSNALITCFAFPITFAALARVTFAALPWPDTIDSHGNYTSV